MMKKLIAALTVCFVLSGCKNVVQHIVVNSLDSNKNESSVIVNVSHLTDYVSVNGKRLYPDS